MTQWRAQSHVVGNTSDGSTEYLGIFGLNVSSITEADVQHKVYTEFVFSDLRINVTTLVDTVYNVSLRDDGNTSSNVTINPTSAAWLEDVTGSETVAVDSLVNIGVIGTAMHGDQCDVDDVLITYEHASIDAPIFGGGINNAVTADRFSALGRPVGLSATEAEVQTRLKRAQVVSNLRTVDTGGGTATFAIRVNGVTSTNVTVALSGANAYEDVTGSETFAADDDGAFILDFTSGTLTQRSKQVDADTAEDWWSAGSESTGSTREYKPFSNRIGNITADDNYEARIGSATAGNLQAYVSSAGGGNRDIKLRIASTDSTNLVLTITGTGIIEDITGSDAIADTENVTNSRISDGGTMTVTRTAVELPFSSVEVDTGEAQPFFQDIGNPWTRRLITLAYLMAADD